MIRENTDDYQGAIVSPIDKLISDIDNFTKSGRGSLTNSIQEGGNSFQDDTKDNNQDDRLSDSYIDEEENQIINLIY